MKLNERIINFIPVSRVTDYVKELVKGIAEGVEIEIANKVGWCEKNINEQMIKMHERMTAVEKSNLDFAREAAKRAYKKAVNKHGKAIGVVSSKEFDELFLKELQGL